MEAIGSGINSAVVEKLKKKVRNPSIVLIDLRIINKGTRSYIQF